jgi:hypothetical protein
MGTRLVGIPVNVSDISGVWHTLDSIAICRLGTERRILTIAGLPVGTAVNVSDTSGVRCTWTSRLSVGIGAECAEDCVFAIQPHAQNVLCERYF